MKHAERLKTILQRDEQERARISTFGADLRTDIRAARQKEQLDRLSSDTQKQVDGIESDVHAELKQLDLERQRVRFPALSASDVATRTLGEAQVRNALDYGVPFDVGALRDAVAIGRIDYASTLLDRAATIEPQTEAAIAQHVAFFAEGRKLFDPMLKDLDDRRAQLQRVLREIEHGRILARTQKMYADQAQVFSVKE